MNDDAPLLVTGATGYIGGRLIPELLGSGRRVRALARTPAKLDGRGFSGHAGLEIAAGDVLDRASLDRALDGVETAYYLVHSLGAGENFAALDARAARTFGAACRDSGVARIIYLSGLGRADDDLSEHLRSRHETGDHLREAGVPVTELRAAIIVGSGSASFEIISDLARKLPVMVTPRWVTSMCEPIAIRDVVWYLVHVLDEPRTIGETFEIGSGEQLTYEELMKVCATEQGTSLRILHTPVLSPRISAYWLHLVTRVDMAVARPLVEGLRNDVICTDTRIRTLLPHDLSPYRLAVQRALAKSEEPGPRESRWTDAQRSVPSPRTKARSDASNSVRPRRRRRRREYRDYRTFDTSLAPSELFRRVCSIGGPGGYGTRPDLLWRIRGVLDRISGGPGLRRGRPAGTTLHVGDAIDFWRVERVVDDEQLRLVAEMRVPGTARLDFRIEPLDDGGARLHQLATLSNESPWSQAYWNAIAPLHDWVFEELGTHVVDSSRGAEPQRAVPHAPQ